MRVLATEFEVGKAYRLVKTPFAVNLGTVFIVNELIPAKGKATRLGPRALITDLNGGRESWWQFKTDIFEEMTDEEVVAYKLSL